MVDESSTDGVECCSKVVGRKKIIGMIISAPNTRIYNLNVAREMLECMKVRMDGGRMKDLG